MIKQHATHTFCRTNIVQQICTRSYIIFLINLYLILKHQCSPKILLYINQYIQFTYIIISPFKKCFSIFTNTISYRNIIILIPGNFFANHFHGGFLCYINTTYTRSMQIIDDSLQISLQVNIVNMGVIIIHLHFTL